MSYLLAVLFSVLFLAFDQWTKAVVVADFALGESRPFISGLLDFTYIHNNGGAWGLMSGHTWLLLTVTLLIMIICVALLLKKGLQNKLLFWSICLILSGGLGNMADRIFRGGEVVDFLHLHFMPSFPVFNIADCAVCIGSGLLLLYFVLDLVREARDNKALESTLNAGQKPTEPFPEKPAE